MHVLTRSFAFAAMGAVAMAGIAIAQDGNQISVDLVTSDGSDAGTVTLRQLKHGLLISADLSNLPEGPHGFHIHEKGICEGDFKSAGSHYAPDGAEHGYDTDEGYHAGDLPNIYVDKDGVAKADIFVTWLTLDPDEDGGGDAPFTLERKEGTAIMVHEKADNYVDMDSAGSRIACGVIVAPSE